MSSKELKGAFNEAAAGQLTCMQALMGYERPEGVEWQRLTFSGTDIKGDTFTARSELLPPHTDLMRAARETALAFIAGKNKAP